ncbi:MAG: hypothetical protein K2P81_09180 [Bacteriovoracaceae bacterium]|nr:hypothetical protein [Bacteriovoracaceae bacterium]
MKILSLIFFFSVTSVFAGLVQAPPAFEYNNQKSIYVDFQSVSSVLSLVDANCVANQSQCEIQVTSKVRFIQLEFGRPLFDLVSSPDESFIDGFPVEVSEIELPGSVSKVRRVEASLPPGFYDLTLKHRFTENVSSNQGLEFGFWYLDLVDRHFLELYLPTNFEFDQFKLRVTLKFPELNSSDYRVFSNGEVNPLGEGLWSVSFPSFYTASSPYLHLFPAKTKKIQYFNLESMDGRTIPVTSYSDKKNSATLFSKKIAKMFYTYERDFGPWPHESFVGYQSQSGGMEYPGATRTSYFALDHEMLHSYFAKGVFPANGNSGWLDEAIAKWHDYGYPRVNAMCFDGGELGAHSVYERKTDSDSYKQGGQLMAYIDYLLSLKGTSLKQALKKFFVENRFKTITTEDFVKSIQKNSNLDITALINNYVYHIPVSLESLENEYGGHLTSNNSYQCFLWKMRYKLIKW